MLAERLRSRRIMSNADCAIVTDHMLLHTVSRRTRNHLRDFALKSVRGVSFLIRLQFFQVILTEVAPMIVGCIDAL